MTALSAVTDSITMVEIVIAFNCILALFCLTVARKLRRWQRAVRRATVALVIAEEQTHQVLSPAPDLILKGQSGAQHLSAAQFATLKVLQQSTQVYQLIRFTGFLWQR